MQSALSGFWKRLSESNNRALGTLFGCIAGGLTAAILVTSDETFSFQIFGSSSTSFGKAGGIILSAGVGGNLSSYIGGSIDIITGDKTIFHLGSYFLTTENRIVQDIPLVLLNNGSKEVQTV